MTLKTILFFLTFLFCLNSFSFENDLELIAIKNDTSSLKIDYTLKVKNNGNQTIKFLKTNELSFMNLGIPSIDFIAETTVNGEIKTFKDSKIRQIDYEYSKLDNYIITIEPNQEYVIGFLRRNWPISSWFSLLNDVYLNVYFTYKIEATQMNFYGEEIKLKKHGIKPIFLISNKINIYFKNTLFKKKYLETKQIFINNSFREYITSNYSSKDLLKKMKKINNQNGEKKEILDEVLGNEQYKYICSFSGKTKDGYNYEGILFEVNSKTKLGIYAGKHYFSKNKNVDVPLEYLFGEIVYPSFVLTDFLYKN